MFLVTLSDFSVSALTPMWMIDSDLCIYSAWDDEQGLVVVGHLPTHLTRTHT